MEHDDLPVVDLTAMPKECQCITHEGLHWIEQDRLWFERNLELLRCGMQQGFLLEEIRRLQVKQQMLRQYVAEGQTFILPNGCNERDYNKRVAAMLEALNVR